jgi:D-glycero-D-manno-heptose 1,7-bisphosphate phosphatase
MALRLVLLDRDGVLNEDRPDSVKRPEELVIIDGAPEAVAKLNGAGLKTAIVTNQSVVGRGQITLAELEAIHGKLFSALRAASAAVDAVFVAPDAPDKATDRRKPGTGMLLEAMAHFDVSPEDTVMIGDSATDAEAAKKANVPFHLVRTGKGSKTERKLEAQRVAAVHDDLSAAVAHLLELLS